MSDKADWEEVLMRVRAVQLRVLAGNATVAAAAMDAAVAVRRFARAWQVAEERDVAAVLFEHPDLVDVDMSDAYWRPE